MIHNSKLLRNFTLADISITLVSLAVAAMAGVLDNIYLAYFWYLALFGIGVMVLITFVSGIMLLANRFVRWYRHQLQTWDGVHPAGV